VAGRLRPLVETGEPVVREAALRLAGVLGVTALHPLATAKAMDPTLPALERAAAVAALGGFGTVEDRQAIQKVAADATAPAVVRSRAIAEWVRLEPTTCGSMAAEFLSTAQPDAAVSEVFTAILARPEAVASLRGALLSRPAHADAAKLALRQMAASGRRDEAMAASLETAAGYQRETRTTSPAAVLEWIAEARRDGDPGRGEVVFRRPELGCVQCHGINATVLGIGPDLGALGTAQTPEFIVGAILEPQREVKEGFFSVTLTLRDGDELTGRLVAEDVEQLVIHDTLTRRDVRVRRDKIASRADIGSVMPPGLADTLTRAEFRDLLRYLMGLGRRAP